jgi:hypothetical protein
MLSVIRRFRKFLYSTITYRLTARPNLQRYVNTADQPSHWDQQGLSIKLADADDFDQLTRHFAKFQGSHRIAERTRRGDVCVVAYKQGVLAHFRWVACTSIPLPELDLMMLRLASDEVYTYDSYTRPRFRRQGIAFAARTFLTTYFTQRGVQTFYTLGRQNNQFTHEHRAFRAQHGGTGTIGTIQVRTILGTKQYQFIGETPEDRELMAHLFRLPLNQVHVRSSTVMLRR